MALTKRQKERMAEAKEIADLTETNLDVIPKQRSPDRLMHIDGAVRQLVIGEIVAKYTLLDEILSDTIVDYFFQTNDDDYPKLWRTDRFRIFVHHILDEMFLLKKAALTHAMEPVPRDIMKAINAINAIRNAVAHSFFPENRKEYYNKEKLVTYHGLDVHRPAGLRLFQEDAHKAFDYFFERNRKRSKLKAHRNRVR